MFDVSPMKLNDKYMVCPVCLWNITIQESTGDWACNNAKCEYFHGAQDLFEKKYVQKCNMKPFQLDVDIMALVTKIRTLENHLFEAEEIIKDMTEPPPPPSVKSNTQINTYRLTSILSGISWLAKRAKYRQDNP